MWLAEAYLLFSTLRVIIFGGTKSPARQATQLLPTAASTFFIKELYLFEEPTLAVAIVANCYGPHYQEPVVTSPSVHLHYFCCLLPLSYSSSWWGSVNTAYLASWHRGCSQWPRWVKESWQGDWNSAGVLLPYCCTCHALTASHTHRAAVPPAQLEDLRGTSFLLPSGHQIALVKYSHFIGN